MPLAKKLKVTDFSPTIVLIRLLFPWSHHCSAIVWHSLPLDIVRIGMFLKTEGVFQRGEDRALTRTPVIDIIGGPGLYHQTLPTNSPSPNVLSISPISTPSKSLENGLAWATTAASRLQRSHVHKNTNILLPITIIIIRMMITMLGGNYFTNFCHEHLRQRAKAGTQPAGGRKRWRSNQKSTANEQGNRDGNDRRNFGKRA